MPETPALRREQRKQDRRDAIIDAARASFLDHGYAATSMSGLLKTLGGSKATLWSYFRSKEDLFAAVVERVAVAFRAELQGAMSATRDPEAALTAFCEQFLRKINSPEGLATWRLVIAESARFPEVGRIFYERAARHGHALLAAYLADQIAHGRLRDEDPARMADMLISLCTGEQSKRLWGVAGFDPAEVQERASRYARWFMRAFPPPLARDG